MGTRPLVIAFLDERPDLQAYEKLAGPQPWPPEEAKGVTIFRRRDGSIADASDGRRRHPRLVSDADLPAEANVILMYPEGMDLEAARRASPLYPAVEFHATLLILPSPRPLSELIAAVAHPPSLRQQVQLVVTMPLR